MFPPLALRERTIYFVHQSAKDFLLSKASNTIFPSRVHGVNYEIFSRSLQVISRTLRRDIYGLRAPGFAIANIKLSPFIGDFIARNQSFFMATTLASNGVPAHGTNILNIHALWNMSPSYATNGTNHWISSNHARQKK